MLFKLLAVCASKRLVFIQHDIRELKNHDDDRKRDTVPCVSAASKFRRRGSSRVDDAKQGRITSSCNPQASTAINSLFLSDF